MKFFILRLSSATVYAAATNSKVDSSGVFSTFYATGCIIITDAGGINVREEYSKTISTESVKTKLEEVKEEKFRDEIKAVADLKAIQILSKILAPN